MNTDPSIRPKMPDMTKVIATMTKRRQADIKRRVRAQRGTKHARGATKPIHDPDLAAHRRKNAKSARAKNRKRN